ncbi:hypothetical protein V6N11_042527 [Hibiscus sabdariffa]|uniref:FBD domain-containing protein n=1 Tax=Hibiscus sabdariffa TaxID=183260 RepID=A0ABR2QX42_9ROSI
MVKLRVYYDLEDSRFRNQYLEKGLETLLPSLPALEKLALDQGVLVSVPKKVPSCLLVKLKLVEISEFENDRDCIEKASYILKNGGALQKLMIQMPTESYSLYEEKKMKISRTLQHLDCLI